MADISSNNRIDVNFDNGMSFGYEDLIGKEGAGGMGDRIAGAYADLNKAMDEAKKAKSSGDPVDLMKLQMSMNALMQVVSTTSQLINSMKQSVDQINQKI